MAEPNNVEGILPAAPARATSPTEKTVELVQLAIKMVGVKSAAAGLGISLNALMRVAAGQSVRPGTLALLEEPLARFERRVCVAQSAKPETR